eukprot:COSAG06_NODE_41_length_30044_cov_24.608382_4_plen_117_part_00
MWIDHRLRAAASNDSGAQPTERATERGLSQCQFVVGDMEQQPFDDASFDVVISNGGFCLCPDKRRAFAEIFRVLAAASWSASRSPLRSRIFRRQHFGHHSGTKQAPPFRPNAAGRT